MRYLFAILIQFALISASAAQETYVFKPGDVIQISVWQEPKLNSQLKVAPDGRVSMPLAGHLQVEGKSSEEVESAIRERLSEKYQTGLDITVSLVSQPTDTEAKDEEQLFFVMGEVIRPGQYPLKEQTTVLQALALAGGLAAFASERRIQVHRRIDGRDALHEFNFRQFKRGRNPKGNIVLKPGDVIVVPENGLLD